MSLINEALDRIQKDQAPVDSSEGLRRAIKEGFYPVRGARGLGGSLNSRKRKKNNPLVSLLIAASIVGATLLVLLAARHLSAATKRPDETRPANSYLPHRAGPVHSPAAQPVSTDGDATADPLASTPDLTVDEEVRAAYEQTLASAIYYDPSTASRSARSLTPGLPPRNSTAGAPSEPNPMPGKPVVTPGPTEPTFRLSGILSGPMGRQAIINGQAVSAGQVICEAKVVRIDADQVWLTYKGRTLNLAM